MLCGTPKKGGGGLYGNYGKFETNISLLEHFLRFKIRGVIG